MQHVAVVGAERRLQPQRLLDEGAHQLGLVPQPPLQISGLVARIAHRGAQQRRGGLAAGAEQRDQDQLGGELIEPPVGAGAGQLAEQIVTRVGRGPVQLLDDVGAQFGDRRHRRGQLVGRHQSVEQLGAGIAPVRQLVGVVVGHADQPGDDHHRQPVGHRIHPLDLSVEKTCRPELVEDLGDQRLEGPHPLGGELRQHQLAVRGVHRVVGGDQDVGRAADPVHLERRHPAVGGVGHRGGEIGREVLRPGDDLGDRGPIAHQVEAGVADPVHRPGFAQPVVERVGILDRGGAEELGGVEKQSRHAIRPTRPGSNVARAATDAAAAETTSAASPSWPLGKTISALSGPRGAPSASRRAASPPRRSPPADRPPAAGRPPPPPAGRRGVPCGRASLLTPELSNISIDSVSGKRCPASVRTTHRPPFHGLSGSTCWNSPNPPITPSDGSSSSPSNGAGPSRPERLAGADGEQRGGADDLAGPQVGAQAGLLQRRGVFEAQPVQRAVQLQQAVAFVGIGRAAGRRRGPRRTAWRR